MNRRKINRFLAYYLRMHNDPINALHYYVHSVSAKHNLFYAFSASSMIFTFLLMEHLFFVSKHFFYVGKVGIIRMYWIF